METARIVSVDYTLYAAKEILKGAHQPLRFIYLSGMLTEKDQSKPLWFMQTARRIRVSSCWRNSQNPTLTECKGAAGERLAQPRKG